MPRKTFLSEWPLEHSIQEAEELAALAKEQGVRTVVGLASRNMPVVLKVRISPRLLDLFVTRTKLTSVFLVG